MDSFIFTGCGVWSSWVQTDDFVWNGTQCLQRHTRSCQSSLFTCNGATEEYRIAPSRDNCTFEKTGDYTFGFYL